MPAVPQVSGSVQARCDAPQVGVGMVRVGSAVQDPVAENAGELTSQADMLVGSADVIE